MILYAQRLESLRILAAEFVIRTAHNYTLSAEGSLRSLLGFSRFYPRRLLGRRPLKLKSLLSQFPSGLVSLQPRGLEILECARASAAATKLRGLEGAPFHLKKHDRRNSGRFGFTVYQSLVIILSASLLFSCDVNNGSIEQKEETAKEAYKVWLPTKTIECLGAHSPEYLAYSEKCTSTEFPKLFGPDAYRSQQFAYVNGDNLRLRTEPSSSSHVIYLLPIAARIRPLIRARGQWILVSFDNTTIGGNDSGLFIGWVHSDFISFPSDFRPTSAPKQSRIAFGSVDSGLCYDFHKNGSVRYTISSKPESPGISGIEHKSGTLLRHKDLLWPRLANPDSDPIILIDRPPELLPEFYYYHEAWLSDPSEPCPE